VVPLDPEEGAARRLAAALRDLRADARLGARLGALNRERVAAAFAFEAMVDAYREVYLDALAGR
jgi:hypothetical protein